MLGLSIILSAALHFIDSGGREYVAVNNLPAGICMLGNEEELVYDATSVNSCQAVELEPGCYRAELHGGAGGGNPDCTEFADQQTAQTVSAIFAIDLPTTVYVFRGGDGVGGMQGGFGSFGGGSSGVDSLLIVGDKVWRATGGQGQTCSYGKKMNVYLGGVYYGAGVGGGSAFSGISAQGACGVSSMSNDKTEISYSAIGSGGGGAPNGPSPIIVYQDSYCPDDFVVMAGAAGTLLRGGDGGGIANFSPNNIDTDIRDSAVGGLGGDTVMWQCGGATAYSYGGGGGGASLYGTRGKDTVFRRPPGNGGSGSVGTSDVSFVRIYKM